MPEIGLLAGRDRLITDAIIARINARPEAVQAEYLTLDGVKMAEPPGYRVILDRISHRVPFYQSYLKNAALLGTRVLNDPFWNRNDDTFLAVSMVKKLGIPVVKTVLLPNREHVAGVVTESLRNRVEPPDWVGAMAYLGFPLLMRPNDGDLDERAVLVHSAEELMARWDASNVDQYILQETAAASQYIRALVIGDAVRLLRWPAPAAYGENAPVSVGPANLPQEQAEQLSQWAIAISEALAHTVNAVDFAVTMDQAKAISLTAAAPALDPATLGPETFAWAVNRTADLLIRLAASGAPAEEAANGHGQAATLTPDMAPRLPYRWDSLLTTD